MGWSVEIPVPGHCRSSYAYTRRLQLLLTMDVHCHLFQELTINTNIEYGYGSSRPCPPSGLSKRSKGKENVVVTWFLHEFHEICYRNS